jgi:nicotinate-nucleotide adenylyltransferase
MAGPEPGTRWGIFGGLFDPVHRGHTILAEEMLHQAGLDGVLFVPSYNPPHRMGETRAPFDRRVDMLRLAVAGRPSFLVSEIEASLDQPGYTLVLITELQRTHPDVEWCFIMGADNMATFRNWYHWEDILRKVEVLAGARPGETADAIEDFPSDRMRLVPTVTRDVSSTEVRHLIKAGTTRGRLSELVPDSVAEYIIEHGLYR